MEGLWMEANLFARLLGCRDQLLDRLEDDGELLIIFFLERFDLARQVAVAVHQTAELHESAHDCDIDLYGTSAAENARKHGNALLGTSVGQVTPATAPSV